MHIIETPNIEKEIQTGEQSLITESVKNLSNKIPNEDSKLIENISQYVKSLKYVNTDEADFTRTADQIIESGEQRGCHEAGLVFATLLRAKGRSDVRYLQAFKRNDLNNYNLKKGGNVGGHVFIKTKEGIINSTSGEITDTLPDEYILGGEGQDAWDIGIYKGLDDYLKLFLKIKDTL